MAFPFIEDLEENDPLKDWSMLDMWDEIDLIHTELENIRLRYDVIMPAPKTKTERILYGYGVKHRLAEILFARSFENEDLNALYSNIIYYAEKCNHCTEEAEYIQSVYRDILYTYSSYNKSIK